MSGALPDAGDAPAKGLMRGWRGETACHRREEKRRAGGFQVQRPRGVVPGGESEAWWEEAQSAGGAGTARVPSPPRVSGELGKAGETGAQRQGREARGTDAVTWTGDLSVGASTEGTVATLCPGERAGKSPAGFEQSEMI